MLRRLLALGLLLTLVGAPPIRPALAQSDPCPEPNNGFNNACFVGQGAPVVQGVISSPTDVDAFKFEVSDDLVQAHIELSNLPADYDLHLFDGHAAFLAEATSQGTGAEAIDLTLLRGNYFVFVNSATGQFAANRAYTLAIQLKPEPAGARGLQGDPCPEPNDAPDQACPVTPGRVAFGALRSKEDIDLYRLEVTERDTRVTASLGRAPDDFRLTMLGADGSEQGQVDPYSTLIGRPEPGTYVFQVSRVGGDGQPTGYELLVTATPPELAPGAASKDPCPEPNDENDKACFIGTDAPARGFISNPADIDRYTFEVQGGRSWVHAELSDQPADYELEIQNDKSESVIASHNSGLFPEAVDVELEPGRYYIAIYSLAGQGSDTTPYTLSLSMVPARSGKRPPAKIMFADNFNSPGAHFLASTNNPERYEIGNFDGEYVIKQHFRPASGFEEVDVEGGADVDNYRLDLDARVTVLPEVNGGVVVSWRYQDSSNTYGLYVDTQNTGGRPVARVARWIDGKFNDLMPWTESPAIKGGEQSNHITIIADGTAFQIQINGQQVFSGRDDAYRIGDIALGAITWDRPVEVRFDNVLVTGLR